MARRVNLYAEAFRALKRCIDRLQLTRSISVKPLVSKTKAVNSKTNTTGDSRVRILRKTLTPEMLKTAKSQLCSVKHVSVPQAKNLRLERNTKGQSAAEFTDFVEKTRRDLSQLAALPSGQSLFKGIEKEIPRKVTVVQVKGGALTEGSGPVQPDKPTRWGKPKYDAYIRHNVDVNVWNPKQPEVSEKGPSQAFEGVGINSALALGHELIHSARFLKGIQPTKAATRFEALTGVPADEVDTVGSPKILKVKNIPTENALRTDLNQALHWDAHSSPSILGEIKPRRHYAQIELPVD